MAERETKSLTGFLHHLTHRVERIMGQETVLAQVKIELDGHLTDIVTRTGVLLPDMLQVGTRYQYHVILPDNLVGVTYDTAHTGSMLHKVQFKDFMIVNRIGELFLPAVSNIERILTHQRRYLMNNPALLHSPISLVPS